MGIATLVIIALAATNEPPARRSVTVNGEAEVKVAPDQVILTVAVETNDKDLLAAKKENDARVKRVMAVAQSFKIESKHLQTDQISIEPRYANYSDRSSFQGYFVRKSIVICLKELMRFEELLTELLKAGSNSVPGIEFQSTEMRKHRDQAREQAARAAKEKADALAVQLGTKLGKVYAIHENVSSFAPRSAYSNATNDQGGAEVDPVPGGFAPGQISIHASLTVEFDLDG